MTVDDKDIRLCKYGILRDEGEENPKVSKFSYRYRKNFLLCWKKAVARKPCAKGILRFEREHSISLDRGLRDKLFHVRERERERERES